MTLWQMLTATRGKNGKLHWTDWVSYGYLILGVFLMFFPVVWLLMSSFKTEGDLQRYPPTFLPYQQTTVELPGMDGQFPLFEITGGEHEGRTLAQLRRVGLVAQMVDPEAPTSVCVSISPTANRCRRCAWRLKTTPACSSASISCASSSTPPSSPSPPR
jgi:ABC-type glycerol-3-phosphate transport system permease component